MRLQRLRMLARAELITGRDLGYRERFKTACTALNDAYSNSRHLGAEPLHVLEERMRREAEAQHARWSKLRVG